MRKDSKKRKGSTGVCSLVSLGCPKNLVDSESILGELIRKGWEFRPEVKGADLVVLNTCGFLKSAREEAYGVLEELLEMKRRKEIGRILVSGCLIRSDGSSLIERFPDVDGWFSPFDEKRIWEDYSPSLHVIDSPSECPGETPKTDSTNRDPQRDHFHSTRPKRYSFHDENRLLLTCPHSAYLKIADGCDRFCSYCAIPSIRGRFTSKPLEAILDEAKRLADAGVRELILIAQETTFWGNDLYGEPRLAELLAKLKDRNDFDWIRLLYAYPLFFDRELTSLFGYGNASPDGTVLLPYVDLPLQHCNDGILRRMNRRVGKTETEELLARLREEIADLTLRTTFITGFPGETDEAFEELLAFVEKWRFERAGVFDFSPEPGTVASRMDGQVPNQIKTERFSRLYEMTERIVTEIARAKVGKREKVLIDSPVLDDQGNAAENFYIGRTGADSPDIDPVVYVTGENLVEGEFYEIEIVDTQGLDLIGVKVD